MNLKKKSPVFAIGPIYTGDSQFQALCQCGRLKKRTGDERGLVEKEGIPLAADPACRPLAFSIVLTESLEQAILETDHPSRRIIRLV